jgi:RimJ/RimL family protein N-acetyltransferase
MTLKIVELRAQDRDRIAAHLLCLSERDRSLRFAAGVVPDESIRSYVAGIRFGSDAVFGAEKSRGELIGLAHGCVYMTNGQTHIEAAFTTDADWRRQGVGGELMRAIEVFAGQRGAHRLVGMCLARNLPMRALFEHAGMALTREDDEMHACRTLDQDRMEAATYLKAA